MNERKSSLTVPSLGLLFAVSAHKGGVLLYGFCLGRWGGTEVLGVMAVVLAWGWVCGTLAGAGLPDRVLVEAAGGHESGGSHQYAQGTFLILQFAATGLLCIVVPWLASEELRGFARLLALGAGLQGVGAVAFGARRGHARPRAEIWATTIAALVLVFGSIAAQDARSFGFVWLFAGACFALGGAVLSLRDAGLWPRLAKPGKEVKKGLPYLAAGMGSFLLGNGDLLIGQAVLGSSEALGEVQVGTLLVRSAGAAPWIVATLALHRSKPEGKHFGWIRQAMLGVLLSAPLLLFGRILVPLVGWGYGLETESFAEEMHISLALSPVLFALLSVVPAAMAFQLGRCVSALWTGVLVFAVFAFAMTPGSGNLLMALAMGQGFSLVVLLWSGRRERWP